MPLVCSVTGPWHAAAVCSTHGPVCFWDGFGLDLESCGAARVLRVDRALEGCCLLASVSDSFLTETQFSAPGGLSKCPVSEACLFAEALATSHLQFCGAPAL